MKKQEMMYIVTTSEIRKGSNFIKISKKPFIFHNEALRFYTNQEINLAKLYAKNYGTADLLVWLNDHMEQCMKRNDGTIMRTSYVYIVGSDEITTMIELEFFSVDYDDSDIVPFDKNTKVLDDCEM